MGPDGQQQSVMALVWVNARFRLHLRSPGAACRRPSGVIRPSAPLPSVAARAVRRQTRNKLFGSTRAIADQLNPSLILTSNTKVDRDESYDGIQRYAASVYKCARDHASRTTHDDAR